MQDNNKYYPLTKFENQDNKYSFYGSMYPMLKITRYTYNGTLQPERTVAYFKYVYCFCVCMKNVKIIPNAKKQSSRQKMLFCSV